VSTNKCIVCQADVPPFVWNTDGPGAKIECRRCGPFRASERLAQVLMEWRMNPHTRPDISERRLAAASGAIRELSDEGRELWVEDIDQLLSSVSQPRDPLEAIDKLVLYVFRKADYAGQAVELRPNRDRSVVYASSGEEFEYLRGQAEGLGLLDATSETTWRLTLEGWRRVRSLREKVRQSDQAFVAMWFGDEMQNAWADGLKPGIEDAGYRPLRIDLQEHNEKIDDVIVAEIKRSGLLVADFTAHRQSVYYEAGFAHGYGIPVIWTCRADHIRAAHFDTRQYNHIVWDTPATLRARLTSRIEATMPLRRS
jgi:nucleoside 2-deoxyribosyltransferase